MPRLPNNPPLLALARGFRLQKLHQLLLVGVAPRLAYTRQQMDAALVALREAMEVRGLRGEEGPDKWGPLCVRYRTARRLCRRLGDTTI
jgi:hypothetical protein